MQFIERDLSAAELDEVQAGFAAHERRHGNLAPLRTRIGFVAVDGDVPIGCATGLRDNRRYDLSDLWVADAHRGLGIGRRLLALREQRIAAEGVVNVYTWITGFQARGFYEARGWTGFAELADCHQNGHSRSGLRKVLGTAALP